ncbi:helix-turn-helix domain-containing protein [Intrasporangium sp. YIM S08009]|uniref:winged helix-turn-helix transcriptional regulator n=1 Tax=Intrasporangium zincisolvens TaxID=3080018 RepID=UPI002B051B15|nr:helix-turn-helix domain-containing protein [Intrasporangium sp. YIM S08009]
MPKATYAQLGDACATAHAMELIGSRWTYPILRELMLGPKRFNELLATVRGITPAVLSGRLRELAATGLVEAELGEPASQHAYALTPWATELGPILRELGRWAQGSPVREEAGGLTPDAAVQAMLTMARPDLAPAPGEVQLYLRDDRVSGVEHPYRVRWDDTGLDAERGTWADPTTTLRADSSTWAEILFAGRSVDGNAEVTGERTPVEALLACFPAA